ncbi:unnamed protein product, partial [Sphagnum compactum]
MCSSVREVPLLSAGNSPSSSGQEKASRWGGRRVARSLLRVVYAPPVYHAELLLIQAARPAYLLPTAQWVDTNAASVSSGEAAGRELTTSEIRSTLLPYLESSKHKEGLADVFVSFPDPPLPRTELVGLLQVDGDVTTALAIPEISFSEYPQLQVHAVDGKLQPSLMYFLHLCFPPEQVE